MCDNTLESKNFSSKQDYACRKTEPKPAELPCGCSRDEALYFAEQKDLNQLMESANKLRKAYFGNKIELCAIINARSGNCGMDCRFCSQSSHNSSEIQHFPLLSDSELHSRVTSLTPYPVLRCGIVTSGGALAGEEFQRLLRYISEQPPANRPRLCASLGRLPQNNLEELYAAGLKRYHHNLESSEKFYPSLCTTQRWQDRAATVRAAKQAGLEVCCGGLFGTGESWNDRIDFAFELRELGVDNIPLNFLYPHPGTPLAGQAILSADEALRIIALFRHILPAATLRICGGRTIVFADREDEIFSAGANALMTGNYLTTTGQGIEHDIEMLSRLGLRVAQ